MSFVFKFYKLESRSRFFYQKTIYILFFLHQALLRNDDKLLFFSLPKNNKFQLYTHTSWKMIVSKQIFCSEARVCIILLIKIIHNACSSVFCC
jgi:hypothetical protein